MPYYTIAIAAFLPALLFYVTIFLQIDAHAVKQGITGVSRDKLPSFYQTFKSGWSYLIALFVLVYFLFVLRRIAECAYISTAILLVCSQLQNRKLLLIEIYFQIFEEIGRTCAMLITVIMGIGMLIGSFGVTGLAFSFAREALAATGGNVVLMLITCAAASYIMGMGMSAIACYIFLAIIMAPPLILVGLNTMAVHLFILYCGMLSYITIPVALAVYPAAAIAGAPFVKVGLQSMKLGMALLFLPFAFVIDSSLVLQAGIWAGLLSFFRTFLGIYILCGVLEEYMFGLGFLSFKGFVGKIAKLFLIISAILIGILGRSSTIIGSILAITILSIMFVTKSILREDKLIK